MKDIMPDQLTRLYLQHCYTCEDAALCATEEDCLNCWTEQGLLDNREDEAAKDTPHYLRMMHV